MMRFVVTTCSIQLISHHVNAKIASALVNRVKETRLSLHVGPTSCYYKLHHVNWPLCIGRYVSNVYCLKELPYQIETRYDFRQRSHFGFTLAAKATDLP